MRLKFGGLAQENRDILNFLLPKAVGAGRSGGLRRRGRRTAPLGCSRQPSSMRPGSSQTSNDLSKIKRGSTPHLSQG